MKNMTKNTFKKKTLDTLGLGRFNISKKYLENNRFLLVVPILETKIKQLLNVISKKTRTCTGSRSIVYDVNDGLNKILI